MDSKRDDIMIKIINQNICIIFVFGLLLSACSEETVSRQEVTPRVKYFEIGERATGQSRRISGKVVAADSSPLSFSVSGTIEEVLVERGDKVRQGQLLARLDSEPTRIALEQARAKLNIERAKLEEAKQNYERTVSVFEKGAGSRSNVERATADRSTAYGKVRSAQSDLDRKQRDLKLTKLVAPFSGTIAERSIEPFQEVSVGYEAFILQSTDALKVELLVPETLIRDVDYGQVVQIGFPTIPNINVSGTVNQISSRAESGNAFPVKIQLSPTEIDLRSGMTASVTFNFDKYLDGKTAYLIPLSAVAIEIGLLKIARGKESIPNNAPVLVINSENKLQSRSVVVGDIRGNKLEVFEGLKAGEKIVSAGVALLREGMQVELWSAEQGLNDG
jgi:RND family efflux transporter MFP subunit